MGFHLRRKRHPQARFTVHSLPARDTYRLELFLNFLKRVLFRQASRLIETPAM
jgi:hypothetical protein